jgi:hypothetical protein
VERQFRGRSGRCRDGRGDARRAFSGRSNARRLPRGCGYVGWHEPVVCVRLRPGREEVHPSTARSVVSDALLRYSPDGSKPSWVNAYGWGGAPQGTQFVMIANPDSTPTGAQSLTGPRTPPLFTWLPDNRHIVRNDGPTVGAPVDW